MFLNLSISGIITIKCGEQLGKVQVIGQVANSQLTLLVSNFVSEPKQLAPALAALPFDEDGAHEGHLDIAVVLLVAERGKHTESELGVLHFY